MATPIHRAGGNADNPTGVVDCCIFVIAAADNRLNHAAPGLQSAGDVSAAADNDGMQGISGLQSAEDGTAAGDLCIHGVSYRQSVAGTTRHWVAES